MPLPRMRIKTIGEDGKERQKRGKFTKITSANEPILRTPSIKLTREKINNPNQLTIQIIYIFQ